jgi:hypothetical protein
MAIDATPRRSRRALLAAGFAAAVAAIAGAGRTNPVRAADGDPIQLGGVNTAQTRTFISNNGGGEGLHVYAPVRVGVVGSSKSAAGVRGASDSGVGVHGISNGNYGVYGESPDNYAVVGLSSTSAAVAGFTESSYAVLGSSASGVGVLGQGGTGRGGRFSGQKAQIRLDPSTAATHPTAGQVGDLFLDNAARLWLCVSAGNPATWRQIAFV